MMRMLGHRPKARRKLFEKVQVIERAVLATIKEVPAANGDAH